MPQSARPKKALGQHFIINPGICPKMVAASGLDRSFSVLEIGPGLGILTAELAKTAKKVVAVELDGDLIPKLRENMRAFDHVEIMQGDILKLDLAEIIKTRLDGGRIAVFGNLPYYITSPIIMRLLESRLPAEMVVAMVQREAAQRLCAVPGSRQAGAVTMAVRYYSRPQICFDVSPGSFFPPPKVTSSVIKLEVLAQPSVAPRDPGRMFAIIKAAFAQRRKTAANAIAAGLGVEKAAVETALDDLGLPREIRPERLTMEQFAQISDRI